MSAAQTNGHVTAVKQNGVEAQWRGTDRTTSCENSPPALQWSHHQH